MSKSKQVYTPSYCMECFILEDSTAFNPNEFKDLEANVPVETKQREEFLRLVSAKSGYTLSNFMRQ